MLVISNGAPKSGTTLYYYYTRNLVQRNFETTSHDVLRDLTKRGKLPGIGNFLREINPRILTELQAIVQENGPLVIKVHEPANRNLLEQLQNKSILMTYGHRDPRDMILSGMDHHSRVVPNGNTRLNGFVDFSSALSVAANWAGYSLEWAQSELAHVYTYKDLVTDAKTEIHRLANYLQIDVSDSEIETILSMEKESRSIGKREYNKGTLSRFQSEMSSDQLLRCSVKLGRNLQLLGYESTRFYRSINANEHMEDDARLINFNDLETCKGHSFRWSTSASFILLSLRRANYSFVIDTGELRPQLSTSTITIFVNAQALPAENYCTTKKTIEIFVAKELLKEAGEQTISFACKPLRAPRDTRVLGFPFFNLTIRDEVDYDNWYENLKPERFLVSFHTINKLLSEFKVSSLKNRIFLLQSNLRLRSLSRKTKKLKLVVNHSEVNGRHGTGILIQHMFPDLLDIGLITTQKVFGGGNKKAMFNHHLSSDIYRSKHKVRAVIEKLFKNAPPTLAYIVPYLSVDLLIASALKDIYGCKICLHLMDDNNLIRDGISDTVMRETLAKSDIVFAISRELADAYQSYYGTKIYYFPPVIPDAWIDYKSINPASGQQNPVIIGNIWSETWLRNLIRLLEDVKLSVDWYCINPSSPVVAACWSELESSRITLLKPLSEIGLLESLASRPYSIVPSGGLTGDIEDNIAKLSLPSRAILLIAATHTPLLVLGSDETAISRFVQRHKVGYTSPYESVSFLHAIGKIETDENKNKIVTQCKSLSSTFRASGIEDWIWESTETGAPIDSRFDDLGRLTDSRGVCDE